MSKNNIAMNILGDLKAGLEKNSIPFMDGKTPGKFTDGEILTAIDYGFITNDDGEYVVLLTKEYKEKFFFGGLVLTDLFKALDTNYSKEDVTAVLEHGIKFTTETVVSKSKKRPYTKVILLND